MLIQISPDRLRLTEAERRRFNSVQEGYQKNAQLIFVPDKDEKPYSEAIVKDSVVLLSLNQNELLPGRYILSFHYYFSDKTYKSSNELHILNLDHHNIVIGRRKEAVLHSSGFYKD